MIDLDPTALEFIKLTIRNKIPDAKLFVFGSRVTGKAKTFSDIDIAVKASEPLNFEVLNELKESFSDSNLSIIVDLSDWYSMSATMINMAEQEWVEI